MLTGRKRNWIRGVRVPGFEARFDQTADIYNPVFN